MADKQHPAIFEATFTHDNILARVDILERLPRNKWRLIEVKSSTSLKDYYLYDVAIQRLILEGLGMKVVPCLMHLNREYVYDGKQYDLEKLFVIRDLTAETAALEQEVKDLLREEWKVLARAKPPDIEPGEPLHPPLRPANSTTSATSPCRLTTLANLPGISAKKLEELASRGIESIGKIPKDFPLTETAEAGVGVRKDREAVVWKRAEGSSRGAALSPLLHGLRNLGSGASPIRRHVSLRPDPFPVVGTHPAQTRS